MSKVRNASARKPHTCPWWFGYTFDNPLRQLVHDPTTILGGLVTSGQSVVDVGCGLGYFSIALAKLVGPCGSVLALDVQQQMVKRAQRRAKRQGMADRIDFRVCAQDRLGLTSHVDFVLAFWVVHEVTDPKGLFAEVRSFLRPNGHFLIAEPKGHVRAARFAETVELARRVGYEVSGGPPVRFSRSIVCVPATRVPGERRPVRERLPLYDELGRRRP